MSKPNRRLSTTRILLVRHGHVEGIIPPRFRGRRDIPLSVTGLRQAQVVATRIATQWDPATIYCSPLRRCVQTGDVIAAACGASVVKLEELNDLHYGDWEWLTHEEASQQFPDLYERWRRSPHLVRFPGGDSLQDLAARVANVVRMATEQHPDETVVLVGHDSGHRAVLLQMLEQPLSAYWRLSQDPCGLSEIEIQGPLVRVLRVNETHHLLAP